jgi:membrane protease YdiL (CAAX protease family)
MSPVISALRVELTAHGSGATDMSVIESSGPAGASDPGTAPSATRPSLGQGLILLLVYAVVVVGGQQVSGVDYDALGATAGNALKGIILPVGAGIVAVLAVGWRWGVHSVWRERPELRLTEPRWIGVIPALLALAILLGVVFAPWGDWSVGVVVLLLVGTLLVGFGEELIFRGFLLLGARQRFSELGAFLLTCALFGLIHGANALTGQAAGPTIRQIASAAVTGAAFYLVRRFTGVLVAAMLLHGLLDFSILIHGGPGGSGNDVTSAAITGAPASIAILITIAATITVFRRARSTPAAV